MLQDAAFPHHGFDYITFTEAFFNDVPGGVSSDTEFSRR